MKIEESGIKGRATNTMIEFTRIATTIEGVVETIAIVTILRDLSRDRSSHRHHEHRESESASEGLDESVTSKI